MGAGGAERIAIDIQTSANTSGTDAAAAGINKVTVSAKQMSEALKQAGGDLTKAAQILASNSNAASAAPSPASGVSPAGSTTTTSAANPFAFLGGSNAPGSPLTASGVAGVTQLNQQLQVTPSRARQAGNAIAVFANSAATGTFSVSSLASATANLSQAITGVVRTTKALAVTSWITLALQLVATAIGFVEKFIDKGKQAAAQTAELESSIRGVNAGLADDKLTQNLEQIRESTEKELEAVRERYRFDILHNAEEQKLLKLVGERGAAQEALARHEFDIRQGDRVAELASELRIAEFEAGRVGQFKVREQQLAREADLRQQEIDREFTSTNLTQEQIKQRNRLIEQGQALTEAQLRRIALERELAQEEQRRTLGSESTNLFDQAKARLDEIEAERKAAIEATEDEATATAVAEQRKRNLYRDTRLQAEASAKTLIQVVRDSGSAQVHAIGTAMETFRRLVIGAEAAHSAVLAIKEGAAAIGSLAIGDFRGAALHGASSLEYAKAAALAGAESLGGGRSGGSGGGGGGGQFVPNSQQNGGNQTVLIQIGDVSNQALVQTVRYELDRSGLLGKPVVVPYGRPS
jgi:hypothetical protein